MPIFSRQNLRQLLTTDYLRDGIVSTLTATGFLGSVNLIDSTQADLSLTGQNLYQRSWLKHNGMELRVASFNIGSGAYISLQIAGTLVVSGGTYERHDSLSPADKDRALNDVIKRVRVRREVAIDTIESKKIYSLEAAEGVGGAGGAILDVLDVYTFSNPGGTLSRGQGRLNDYTLVNTGSRREIRIEPALGQSQQFVMDAILTLTLGAADTATINIPDERWVLSGAAAKALDFLIRKTPGQQRGALEKDRREFAIEFTRLSSRFQPQVDRDISSLLDEPFDVDLPF